MRKRGNHLLVTSLFWGITGRGCDTTYMYIHSGAAPWGEGGKGGKSPPKDLKKGGKWKNMMYFQASKLLKLAFLSSLTRKYVLLKGFYHDFSTKKASALGGFAPWAHNLTTSLIGETFYLTCSCSFTNLPDDKENFCPLDPRGSFAPPPKDLPWCRPCIHFFLRDRVDVVCYKCSQTVLITNLGICFLASSSDDTPHPGRSLVFEAAKYHSHKKTFKTHPKHIFFRYVNKP